MLDKCKLVCYYTYMKGRYFHSNIEGFKVKFTHGENGAYTAFIYGLNGVTYHGTGLKDISDKVRLAISVAKEEGQDEPCELNESLEMHGGF